MAKQTRVDKAISVAKSTMTGDLRDVLLDIMRDRTLTGKAWKDMKEDEQRRVRDMIVNRVEISVGRAVDIIASEGRRHVKVLLKSVTVKDGIKGSFETSKTAELRHELIDAQGDNVLVVLIGKEKYHGEKAPVKIDKDQPNLPMKESEENGQTTEEVNHDPETGEVIEDTGSKSENPDEAEGQEAGDDDGYEDEDGDDEEDDTEIDDEDEQD